MISKSRFTINTIESSTYSFNDSTKYYILDGDMSLGFQLVTYASTNKAQNEVNVYLYQNDYIVNTVTNKSEFSSRLIETTFCNSSMFDKQIFEDQEGIISYFFCPKNPRDLYLKGSASSYEFSYFTIEVYKSM